MRGNINLVCAQPTLDCYFLEAVVGIVFHFEKKHLKLTYNRDIKQI